MQMCVAALSTNTSLKFVIYTSSMHGLSLDAFRSFHGVGSIYIVDGEEA